MVQEGLQGAHSVGIGKFTGIMWGGVAFSACLLILRIYLRIITFHKLWTDDALVVVAWLLLLARSIVIQHDMRAMFLRWETNKEEYLSHVTSAVVTSLLFLFCLWAIKLSFLIFFRRVGQSVRRYKYLWWSITGITVISLVACLAIPWWRCLEGTNGELNNRCSGIRATDNQRLALQVGTALDIITDASIMILPFWLLWHVRVNWRQKLALSGIFFITIFVIIFAIVRVIVTNLNSAQVNEIQLYLWSSAEMTVGVVVACVGPFRQFYVKQESGPHPIADRICEFYERILDRIRNKTKRSFSNDISLGDNNQNTGRRPVSPSSLSTVPILPLNCIHVGHDVAGVSDIIRSQTQAAEATIETHHPPPQGAS